MFKDSLSSKVPLLEITYVGGDWYPRQSLEYLPSGSTTMYVSNTLEPEVPLFDESLVIGKIADDIVVEIDGKLYLYGVSSKKLVRASEGFADSLGSLIVSVENNNSGENHQGNVLVYMLTNLGLEQTLRFINNYELLEGLKTVVIEEKSIACYKLKIN